MLQPWKRNKRTSPSPFMIILCYVFTLLLFYNVDGYTIRPATAAEVTSARRILFQLVMNPFSISTETLLVACEEESSSDEAAGDSLLGFGQIRPLDDQWSELASLYVVPERRQQRIGSAIVQALMDRHCADEQHPKVCLLTLKPTVKFYEPFGFRLVANEGERKMLPKAIQLEFQAGNALSFILGNDLVCMVEQKP